MCYASSYSERSTACQTRQSKLYHPCATLIKRPELAKYVRCVTESGAVHFQYRHLQPTITRETLHALSLCTNLSSLTWTDDSGSVSYLVFGTPFNDPSSSLFPSSVDAPLGPSRRHGTNITYESGTESEHPLLSLLAVIKAVKAPLRELTIQSHGDLGPQVWSELSKWMGLSKIGIWCMDGPPRVLQGWAGQELGKTLTQLELGRCAGVPPTILISVLSQLPRLQDLCLKGAPAAAILTIVTTLPSLLSLDTDYLDSGSGNVWPRGWLLRAPVAPHSVTNGTDHSPTTAMGTLPPMPTLRNLTVRTSSIDSMGPNKLFTWIRVLVSNPGLECFRLLTFTTCGHIAIPRGFILEMARVHGSITDSFDCWLPKEKWMNETNGGDGESKGLKRWIVGQTQMTLSDIECVCKTFTELEDLACSVAVVMGDVESIMDAISSANNLRTLRLHVQWIPSQHQHQRHQREQGHFSGQLPSMSTNLHSSNQSDLSYHNTNTLDSDSELDSETDYDSILNFNQFDEASLRYATLSRYLNAHKFKSSSNSHSDTTINGHGTKTMSKGHERPFTPEHAREMMLREGSKLRVVAIGGVVYTGKWVWDGQGGKRAFEVEDMEEK
ncbi:hypothetical protein AX15_004395 [Amanita polypyramis BW_CC]|nr:hypothetical protein AX15_004395 [Amanita polypyramis BW_CC]